MGERASRGPWIPAPGVGVSLFACAASLCLGAALLFSDAIGAKSPAAPEPLPPLRPVTAAQRLDALKRARVREEVDVASRDLYHGPRGVLSFGVDEEIRCDFVPRPIRGWSEKFFCRLDDGRVFKVKYVENDRFKEVYGEVLGTRLFWALGFYTDRQLPVRVTCRGCPRHPWEWVNAGNNPHKLNAEGAIQPLPPEAEVGTYTFDPAAIEEPVDAAWIEERPGEGVAWRSLDLVDASAGGASKADLDALRLLAAFIQCADNSAEQNVLACPRGEILGKEPGLASVCRRPIVYVGDLGAVFGHGGLTTAFSGRVDYDGWKALSVWRDADTCTARLNSIGGPLRPSTLRHPVIGEAGRALLASLLGRLSDRQIADLFRAARIERLHQTIWEHGREHEVTLDDWVALFRKKREEITRHPGCPRP
ncbi:MAG TPA: hypothetical protein VGS03_19340 [Candidatus Polarisedimenticolia bacterium]|nr:hypothetical protein [Candidatus Polarisedimenticolia bacterium]